MAAKFVKERLAAIAGEMPDYDIACLQEVGHFECCLLLTTYLMHFLIVDMVKR